MLATLTSEKERRRNTNRLAAYVPYRKQAEFHAAGAVHRERLFLAGNQLGKTSGRRRRMGDAPHRPLSALVGRQDFRQAGEDVGGRRDRGKHARQSAAHPGRAAAADGSLGHGLIPGDAIVTIIPGRGVPNGLDAVVVRHAAGGESVLSFKSYERGREKWQGETLEGVWFDEEPPLDIYTEGLTRTNATAASPS